MVIGVDIGTTNVKAVAMNAAGEVLVSAERRNETLVPQPGWSEQDPEAIFQNTLSVLKEVIQDERLVHHGESVEGIVFSSAMHGLLAVDDHGRPLTNVWLWSDLRAEVQARQLRQEGGGGIEIYRRTGVPIHPMSPLCKLIWMRQHQPDIYQAAHKFLGIKEFVWHRLAGKYESDISCASATGLMNIWKNEWDTEAMALVGISAKELPSLVLTTHKAQLSESFKLTKCSLIIGASDGALANLGSGATKPGQLAVTIGTSAAIRCVSDAPVLDDAMRTFCYRLDEKRCIVGGASNNGANVLEWLRTVVFRSNDSAEKFVRQGFEVSAGAEGLTFLPYIQGERAPLWDAQAKGSFQGLTVRHGQAHFVRAALEGVVFNLKLIADGMHTPTTTIHASGGFSQSVEWVQLLADVFQVPVLLSGSGVDASVLGAIHVGRLALGLPEIIGNQVLKTIFPHAYTR